MRSSNCSRFTVAAGLAIEIARRRIVAANARQQLAARLIVPRQGPQGEMGPAGRDGVDGKDGIHGRDGQDGIDGVDGLPGAPGAKGATGKAGEAGPGGVIGDAPTFEWDGSRLRVENPDGTWDKFVDLEGPKGAQGARGAGQPDTRSETAMFDLDQFPAATSSEVPTEVVLMQDGGLVRFTWEQFVGSLGFAPSVEAARLLTEGGQALLTEGGDSISVDGMPK